MAIGISCIRRNTTNQISKMTNSMTAVSQAEIFSFPIRTNNRESTYLNRDHSLLLKSSNNYTYLRNSWNLHNYLKQAIPVRTKFGGKILADHMHSGDLTCIETLAIPSYSHWPVIFCMLSCIMDLQLGCKSLDRCLCASGLVVVRHGCVLELKFLQVGRGCGAERSKYIVVEHPSRC